MQFTLQELGLLDAPPEPEFDNLSLLACDLLDVPMAHVSILDHEKRRIFYKSQNGHPAPLAEVEAKASKIFFSSLNRVTCCRSRETSIRQRWSGQFIWDNGDQRSCGSAGRDSSESGASSFRFGSWGFMPRRSMSARSFSIAGFLAVRSLSP